MNWIFFHYHAISYVSKWRMNFLPWTDHMMRIRLCMWMCVAQQLNGIQLSWSVGRRFDLLELAAYWFYVLSVLTVTIVFDTATVTVSVSVVVLSILVSIVRWFCKITLKHPGYSCIRHSIWTHFEIAWKFICRSDAHSQWFILCTALHVFLLVS